MKKTFKFNVENKVPERQLDSIKYEIRKYIKREKRKTLPEGVDFWKFECKFGKDAQEPQVIEFVDITKMIDEAFNEKCETFYMEIIATKGYKTTSSDEEKEEE